jgi:hypothetical protein
VWLFLVDTDNCLVVVSRDMDTEVRKVPLGVTSAYVLGVLLVAPTDVFSLPSIAPFNFPAYVSLSVENPASDNESH